MAQKQHSTFQSKAEREQESDLRSKYRELGNPELVAAIKQQKQTAKRQPQLQTAATQREHD